MDGLPKFANLQDEPRRIAKDEIELAPDGLSIDLLRAVYRNPALDLSVRMRAASMAIAYEMPKLMAVAQVSEKSFADLLDKRLQNLKRLEQINGDGGAPKQIEARPIEVDGPRLNRRPLTNDRRYRHGG